MRHPGPFFCVPSAGQSQNSFQPGTALGQVFPHIPESKQSHAETQTPVQIHGLKQPVEGETKIIDLNVALRQPASPIGRAQLWISFLRQDQTVRRMCPPRARIARRYR